MADALQADAGVLDPAKGDVPEPVARSAVDADAAGFEAVGHPHGAVVVAREHRRIQSQVAAVGHLEGLVLVGDAGDGRDLGLDAAVFTGDYDRAMRVADRLEAGGVRINGAPSHGLGDVPFGGVKDSGIGRQGIGYTIESFVETKSVIL